MRKRICFALLIVLITALLCGCCLSHEWKDATCTSPKICTKCEETDGEPLGHVWEPATCSSPKHCPDCGALEGDSLPHTWEEATCSNAKYCTVCGTEDGKPLFHNIHSDGSTLTEVSGYVELVGDCSVCNQTGVTNTYSSWEEAAVDIITGNHPGSFFMNSSGNLNDLDPAENFLMMNADKTCELMVVNTPFEGTWKYVSHGYDSNMESEALNFTFTDYDGGDININVFMSMPEFAFIFTGQYAIAYELS